MKHIRQFQASGDAREDSTEGHSHILVPGRVPVAHITRSTLEVSSVDHVDGHFNRQSEFLNPTYLHSASGPDVDRARLAQTFGEFLVEIAAPDVFLRRLLDAAVANGIQDRTVDFLDAFPVAYTKGDIQAEPADFSDS